MITGENGTGKELVARELYRSSLLAKQPLHKSQLCSHFRDAHGNCDFFGHEKDPLLVLLKGGKDGFELADGGTILLDEISEISSALQAKLLRVLQEKEFERVGGKQNDSGKSTSTCHNES